MKLVDYLYYHLYKMPIHGSSRNTPEFTTPCYLALLFYFNFVTITEVLHLLGFSSVFHQNTSFGFVMLGLFLIALFVRYRKKKRVLLINSFNGLTIEKKTLGRVIVILYGLISTILLVYIPLTFNN